MFFRNVLASIFHLFAVFSFLAAGSFSLALFFSENARWVMIQYLFAESHFFLWAASGLFGIGLLLMGGVYAIHRGKYLRLKLGKHRADIDVGLIHAAIEQCIRKNFPGKIALLGVMVAGKKRLEIEVETEEPRLLEPLEVQLIPLLRNQFGMINPFYLVSRSLSKD